MIVFGNRGHVQLKIIKMSEILVRAENGFDGCKTPLLL